MMDFVIISKLLTKEEAQIEAQLLRASVLFANKVHHASDLFFRIDIESLLQIMNERQKIDIYKFYFGQWKTDVTPERIEKNYQNLLKLRKVKRKIKEELLLILRYENFIKVLKKAVLDSTQSMIDELKLNGIKNFYDHDDNNIIIGWGLVHYISSPSVELTFHEAIFTTLDNSCDIPLFFYSMLETIKGSGSGIQTDIKKYLECPLFTFPSPESLTESQIKIFRNDLKQKLSNFFGLVEVLKQKLRDIPYDELCSKGLQMILSTEFYDSLNDLQKAIDENIYIEQLKSLNPDGVKYGLYMGISSLASLIDIYKNIEVLNTEQELYVKEQMRGLVNLSNTTPFLYLKAISG